MLFHKTLYALSQFHRQVAKRREQGLENPKDNATPKQAKKKLKRKFASIFTEKTSQRKTRKEKKPEAAEKPSSTELSSPPKKRQRLKKNDSQET